MKQGYYDYTYVAVDKNNFGMRNELDGNYFETENLYTILVYYKSFTDRSDQLIGVATFDSRTDKPGLSFWVIDEPEFFRINMILFYLNCLLQH